MLTVEAVRDAAHAGQGAVATQFTLEIPVAEKAKPRKMSVNTADEQQVINA